MYVEVFEGSLVENVVLVVKQRVNILQGFKL